MTPVLPEDARANHSGPNWAYTVLREVQENCPKIISSYPDVSYIANHMWSINQPVFESLFLTLCHIRANETRVP